MSMCADVHEIIDLIKSGRADLARTWLEMVAKHAPAPSYAEYELAAKKRRALEAWAAKQPKGRVS